MDANTTPVNSPIDVFLRHRANNGSGSRLRERRFTLGWLVRPTLSTIFRRMMMVGGPVAMVTVLLLPTAVRAQYAGDRIEERFVGGSVHRQENFPTPPSKPFDPYVRPGTDVIRGQTPNHWSDYQPPAQVVPGSDGQLRGPMTPSGTPRQPAPNYWGPSSASPSALQPAPPAQEPGTTSTFQPAPAPGHPLPPGHAPPPGYAPPPGHAPPPGYAPAPAPAFQPPSGQVPPSGFGPSGNVFGPGFPPETMGPPLVEGAPMLPEVPLDVVVTETRTGRFMLGAGVNSDAGVTGQIVLDERNFDLFNVPTSFQDFVNGTAFRGAGQGFRVEAVPGNVLQRYMVNFTEPYLFGFMPISMNVSGFLFDRLFQDWDEQRLGGRLAFGYRLTPDLSLSLATRGERVSVRNPRVATVDALNEVVGKNEFYSGRVNLTHDTRDIPFAPTEGHLIELGFEQAFGDFTYPRAEFDVRRYFLMRERPDGSGRHTLSFGFRGGFSGTQTPLFENYFAGGFSTLRGFAFRGASPVEDTVQVGGRFRFLGTVEYMFPLTADDMMKGVVFTDFGTVEQDIRIRSENYRVAPGAGLRISIPALGPAPLAFDFAFPVAYADTDEKQVFSFFMGFNR